MSIHRRTKSALHSTQSHSRELWVHSKWFFTDTEKNSWAWHCFSWSEKRVRWGWHHSCVWLWNTELRVKRDTKQKKVQELWREGGCVETQGGNGTPPWFSDQEQRQPLPLTLNNTVHCEAHGNTVSYNKGTPVTLINIVTVKYLDDIKQTSTLNNSSSHAL